MSEKFIPQDQRARDRIQESLDETLFVEAGAGTGKTTALVGRIVNLVASDRTTLDRIAAITFTEAAAAELRERVRSTLEEAASDCNRGDAERERCARGVADLDSASIQTLHSFAMSLLQERPLEAGLPPAFDTMDEISGSLDFDERWDEWLDWALEGASNVPTLPLALSLGMTTVHLRGIAEEFHENYDLLEGAAFPEEPKPRMDIVSKLASAAPELERLLGYVEEGKEDALYEYVSDLLPRIARLKELPPDSLAAYRFLVRAVPKNTRQVGAERNWLRDPETRLNACKAMKGMLADLRDAGKRELELLHRYALMPLLAKLKAFTLENVAERKRQGKAGFHDMLVWACDMLRDDIRARDHFRDRFSHLLVDETQDTDPIQAEIIMFLAEDVAPGTPHGDRPRDWERVKPVVGKLFVVGDPKQSIYRFRRADIRQMRRLRERIGGATLQLGQNFRSHEPIVDWVNYVFDKLMEDEYAAIHPRWQVDSAHPRAPAVWRIGDEMEGNIALAREEEALEVSALLSRIVVEKWQARADDGSLRAAKFSDICILLPRRTGLEVLEDALDAESIPYRLEGKSMVYGSQEARDLFNCLSAVDDPSDMVATAAALRSPAFACSDVDLLRYYESGGRFDYRYKGKNAPPGAVSDALDALAEFHERRMWVSIPALIDRFIRDRMLMQAAIDSPKMREQWRRYRFMVERARAFSDAGGGSLRAFLDWTRKQMSERQQVEETPAQEMDEDVVRIMTVHASKGLEFPIVILMGINSPPQNRPKPVLFDRENGGAEAGVGDFQTSGYEALKDDEKRERDAEGIRLQYVAATRAKDHLVVSLYRGSKRSEKTPANGYDVLLEEKPDLWNTIPDDHPDTAPPPPAAPAAPPPNGTLAARQRWLNERDGILSRQGKPASVAATKLVQIDKALDESEDETEEKAREPWRRGRAGTAIGRAVHAVLQTVDLETGDGIEETARAQAAAEGIPDRYDEVERLSRTAVESDIVKRAAASGGYWREVPVGVLVGDGVLEGFVDLLFEDADGSLVVVDYKTDAVSRAQAAERADSYRLQAGGYALAVQEATGKRVSQAVFLFLSPKREESFHDIPELIAEAGRTAKEHLSRAPA